MSSSEESEIAVYAVVYVLEEQEWKVLGQGWSEVHLCHDGDDGSRRVVAWTSEGQDVLLNATVSSTCKYARKTDDFHKFFDQDKTVYGFGFFPSEASLDQAQKFMRAMESAIGSSLPSNTDQNRSQVPTLTPRQHSSGKMMAMRPSGTLGTLEIVPARAGRGTTGEDEIDAKGVVISDPMHVQRTQHVSYDPVTNTYHGLPDEWRSLLSKQFGVPPETVDCVKLDNYKSKIPRVLIVMKQHLFNGGGKESVGIFRLAPNSAECAQAKMELQKGTFESCNDVNVMANLIKVYFRDLPEAILAKANSSAVSDCESFTNCANIVENIPEPSQSLFLWLLDVCVEIAANSSVNKMNAKNLAIVFAPNLFRASDTSLGPMESLMFSQRVALFVEKSIEMRASANV